MNSDFFPQDSFVPEGSILEWPWSSDNPDTSWMQEDALPIPSFMSDHLDILQPSENRRICFGSIARVEAKVFRFLELTWQNSGLSNSVQLFPITREGEYLSLEYNDMKFGYLSKAICQPLGELVTSGLADIRAYATESDWKTMHGGWWRNGGSGLLSLEINVYGAYKDAVEVGYILSQSSNFLQPPLYGMEDVEYHNPHILKIAGYEEEDLVSTPTPTPNDMQIHHTPRQGVQATPASDSEVVDNIFDSLSHHTVHQEISTIRGIDSQLLPHQKEAIDFIYQRERGQGDSKLGLWVHRKANSDKPFYQHVITGAKREEPTEAKSGIIADEMGLGKSLVILSIISSSLRQAETFGSSLENQEALSQSTQKVPSRATLIVVPSSLLVDNWVDEIRKHTSTGILSYYSYLGQKRKSEKHLLRESVIVFTTYATVAAEFGRGDTTLTDLKWFRVVLDEAHDIRNPKTNQFRAVANLTAEHRWCLTGTPIQNSLEDLGALVTFLRIPIMSNTMTFRKFITNPIVLHPTNPNRFQNLQTLLRTICIRRTRHLIDLPEPIHHYIRVAFTHDEHRDYQKLLEQCSMEVDRVVSSRRKNLLKSAMLESLLKLRLFCNNGRAKHLLQIGKTGLPVDFDVALEALRLHDMDVCGYCSIPIHSVSDVADTDSGIFLPKCCHLVCYSCITHHRKQKNKCPSCVSGKESPAMALSFTANPQVHPRGQGNDTAPSEPYQYPSKLLRLLHDIRQDLSQKCIVFSSWKKTLVLVTQLLQINGIKHEMIDGSKPLVARLKILSSFRSPIGANVLLMTLGTGAVGLNLAVASRVYLMEPQWNPSIESQAIGRALRLGQAAQVSIIRYIMVDSIEEKNVWSRQRGKIALAGGGFGAARHSQPEKFQELLGVFGVDPARVR